MGDKKYKDKKTKGVSSFIRLITLVSLVGVIYKKISTQKEKSEKNKVKGRVSNYFNKFVELVEEFINEEDDIDDGEIVAESTNNKLKKKDTNKKKVKIVNLKVEEKKSKQKQNKDSNELTDRQTKILELIKDKKNLTMSEIRNHIDSNLSERTLRRDLAILSNGNFIEKSGNTKGAIYSSIK
jgi:hypothetical protein